MKKFISALFVGALVVNLKPYKTRPERLPARFLNDLKIATVTLALIVVGLTGFVSSPSSATLIPHVVYPPVVAEVYPTSGPFSGGTLVTIFGDNFTCCPTSVVFGSQASTSVLWYNSGEIQALSPPATAAGTVDVRVTNSAGESPIDAATDEFTYDSPPGPVVSSVSPNTGPSTGGTTVTILGSNFTGVTGVYFSGTPASGFTFVSDTEIDATSPPGSGTAYVQVSTPYGTSVEFTGTNEFSYTTPSSPPPSSPPPSPPTPPAPPHGYWLVGSDGGIFTFGSALFHGSTGSLVLQRPVVGMVPTNDDGGYWLDASDGGVFSFGDTQFYGSIPGLGLHPAGSGLPNSLNAPIVGMVPSDDDGGYFMVASDGGVFAFGDAKFEGSCPGIGGCSGAAVAVMPDASGNGYWLVTRTGSVYPFGDAAVFGEPGPQSVPVTSAVRTPDGGGYWILFANGVVAPYGDANYYGNTPTPTGGWNPSAAIFTTSDGAGYWVATANGTVYPFGDAPNDGGMNGTNLNGAIIAATGF
jgi:hypothetical protein